MSVKFDIQTLKLSLVKSADTLKEVLSKAKTPSSSEIGLFSVALSKDMNAVPVSYETNKYYRALSVLQMPEKGYYLKIYLLNRNALQKVDQPRLKVIPTNLESHEGIGSKVMNIFSSGLSSASSLFFGKSDKSQPVVSSTSQPGGSLKVAVNKPNEEQKLQFLAFQKKVQDLPATIGSFMNVGEAPKPHIESKDGTIVCTFVSQTRFERSWNWDEILKFTEYSR